MKKNLITEVEQQYNNVKFDMSLKDTVDYIKSKNIQTAISLYTVKNNQIYVTTVDGDKEIDLGPHGFQVQRSLSLILKKYKNFEIKFLFWKYDNLIPTIYNYPIFGVSNIPSEKVYNPLVFHDYLFEIPELISKSNIQPQFEQKKKVAYARTGLTGIYSHRMTNHNWKHDWMNHYKISFGLFSNKYPDKCDFKLFLPNESDADAYFGEMKDVIMKSPIFTPLYDQLYIHDLWKDQLNVQINLLFEGNSSISHGRLLQSLYNNGHIIRIGPVYNIGLIEMMINACDYKLFNAVCYNADNQFMDSINSLIDNSSKLKDRRKYVLYRFSQDYLVDVMYELYKLYSSRIK